MDNGHNDDNKILTSLKRSCKLPSSNSDTTSLFEEEQVDILVSHVSLSKLLTCSITAINALNTKFGSKPLRPIPRWHYFYIITNVPVHEGGVVEEFN